MKVTKGEAGYYISGTPLTDLMELPGAVRALKKPIPICAFKV